MKVIIQASVSALETAFLDAEAAAQGLPDGPVKSSAISHLAAAHAAAQAEFSAFIAETGEETEGVALRSGGTGKDDPDPGIPGGGRAAPEADEVVEAPAGDDSED
jgi:hypothetical protein